MNIAVLFDGAGLARLGLEQAGHNCYGFELDPVKHYLGKFVGSGQTFLKDVKDVDLRFYDAVWASPPCQEHSFARTQGAVLSEFGDGDLLAWSLALADKTKVLWVENVFCTLLQGKPRYNAAQFTEPPIQNRNRIVAGKHELPKVLRPYKPSTGPAVCPCITATEYSGCATDTRRASRWYGRKLTVDECAYHQGFQIPDEWRQPPAWWAKSKTQWLYQIYEAIGNGVPVYMAKAFGDAYAERT